MKKLIYLSSMLFIGACLIVACQYSGPEVGPPLIIPEGRMVLKFDNIAGNEDLVLDNKTYSNSFGEDLTISKFNYFVSNFKLLEEGGDSYTIPQDSSYFRIVEADPKTQTVILNGIPQGKYTGIEYIIGVDSLRSVSGIEKRGGALDPSGDMAGDGMYWAWTSGYIFVKLEGTSSKSSSSNGKFYYHIGFYGGFDSENKTVNNIKNVKINFAGEKAVVTGDSVPEVRLTADVLKVFNGPDPVSVEKNPGIMFDFTLSSGVANNYKSMFGFGEIKQNSLAK
ncbi:hypothetical protein L0657_05980 [Dyadobacter sp. CY345]|uniref:MbnP family protein n=1 Tax=Dyadobacter sp. CY345 TaxID=2909335 RepID=UPI001F34FB88|nr:MbnP family protein [Dyadobacter sp. CY345]MCF2443500.1 hypothetical protein [Dyadobacter sp. CY345]